MMQGMRETEWTVHRWETDIWKRWFISPHARKLQSLIEKLHRHWQNGKSNHRGENYCIMLQSVPNDNNTILQVKGAHVTVSVFLHTYLKGNAFLIIGGLFIYISQFTVSQSILKASSRKLTILSFGSHGISWESIIKRVDCTECLKHLRSILHAGHYSPRTNTANNLNSASECMFGCQHKHHKRLMIIAVPWVSVKCLR